MSNGPTPRAADASERPNDDGSGRRRIDRRRATWIAGVALLAPLLSACGAMPPAGPATPTPGAPGTPTAPPRPTAAGATKKGITIGDLTARIAASWPGVTS